MVYQVGIVIAAVAGDLGTNPGGDGKVLSDHSELYFGQDQSLVFSFEFVYFPNKPLVRNFGPGFFDEGFEAEMLKYFYGIVKGNGVLVLGACPADTRSLDGEKTLITNRSHSHGAPLFVIEITLTVEDGSCQAAPALIADQEFFLNLFAHMDDLCGKRQVDLPVVLRKN